MGREELLKNLKESGHKTVWLLKEYRQEDMKSKEKLSRFYAEKVMYSIGYFADGKFIILNVINKE